MNFFQTLHNWLSGLLRPEKETPESNGTADAAPELPSRLVLPAVGSPVAVLFRKAVDVFHSVVVSAPVGLAIAGLLLAPFANTLQADHGNSGDPTCWSKFEIQGSDTDCGCGIGCASRKQRRYDTGWWKCSHTHQYDSDLKERCEENLEIQVGWWWQCTWRIKRWNLLICFLVAGGSILGCTIACAKTGVWTGGYGCYACILAGGGATIAACRPCVVIDCKAVTPRQSTQFNQGPIKKKTVGIFDGECSPTGGWILCRIAAAP